MRQTGLNGYGGGLRNFSKARQLGCLLKEYEQRVQCPQTPFHPYSVSTSLAITTYKISLEIQPKTLTPKHCSKDMFHSQKGCAPPINSREHDA